MASPRYTDLGDADVCPLNPEHGRMVALKGTQLQWCRHQSHDGNPKTHPDGETPRTRALWPLGTDALAAAVKETLG